jgi:hypothetical protein
LEDFDSFFFVEVGQETEKLGPVATVCVDVGVGIPEEVMDECRATISRGAQDGISVGGRHVFVFSSAQLLL